MISSISRHYVRPCHGRRSSSGPRFISSALWATSFSCSCIKQMESVYCRWCWGFLIAKLCVGNRFTQQICTVQQFPWIPIVWFWSLFLEGPQPAGGGTIKIIETRSSPGRRRDPQLCLVVPNGKVCIIMLEIGRATLWGPARCPLDRNGVKWYSTL